MKVKLEWLKESVLKGKEEVQEYFIEIMMERVCKCVLNKRRRKQVCSELDVYNVLEEMCSTFFTIIKWNENNTLF